MLPMDPSRVGFVIVWLAIYSVILIGLIVGIISWISKSLRKKREKGSQFNLTFLQVKLPKTNEVEIKAAEQLFASLSGLKKSRLQAILKGQHRISFEIVSKKDGIGFYVVVPDEIATIVEKQINATYPAAEIDLVHPHEIWDRGHFTKVTELKLKGAAYYPIKTFEELQTDPLNALTSSMSKLGEEDVLAIQYVIQPASNSWRSAGQSFISKLKAKANDSDKNYNIDTSFVEGVENKIKHPGFDVKIRLVAIAKDSIAANSLLKNVEASFEQFTDIKYNKFIPRSPFQAKKWIDDFIYRRINVNDWVIPLLNIPIYRNCSILNTTELATVFHFPNSKVETPNIIWLTSRSAGAPANTPSEGLYLGKNIFRGQEKKVYLKESDRQRHLYIIGQTGTGKSVFMSSLAYQDILNGQGVVYIDPHGSEIDKLLQQIPEERLKDVILFDVSDTKRPLGINILEAYSEEEKHLNINAFISLLYKMYDPNRTGIMGPQLERAIRNVMLTAMTDPEATMVDVLRLLIDSKYADKFIDAVQDPLVKRYWTDEMAKTSDFHKSEKMGYFVSKFDRFLTDITMRNILGQPKSAINFEKAMAEKKIVLVDLSKGKIGEENSNFLGLILVPKILSAALKRAKMISEGKDFPNFYLYVDEFQNFATPDFATILSEARKYKLNLTVAHQFISQLPEDIKEAIFGNVGTMMTFRIGIDDAEFLQSQYEPQFTKKDLLDNTIGKAVTRLLIDGHPSQPFSLATDWPWISGIPTKEETSKTIKEQSRMNYGKDVKEVEEYIAERAGFNESEEEKDTGLIKGKLPF